MIYRLLTADRIIPSVVTASGDQVSTARSPRAWRAYNIQQLYQVGLFEERANERLWKRKMLVAYQAQQERAQATPHSMAE